MVRLHMIYVRIEEFYPGGDERMTFILRYITPVPGLQTKHVHTFLHLQLYVIEELLRIVGGLLVLSLR